MDFLVFTAGFALIALASKQMGQGLLKTGLPLISGFLFTGIIAGPYGLNLISDEAVRHLRMVDQLALGFIAYAAGGELYLKELKNRLKSIAWITSGLVLFTFTLTSLTFFLLSDFIPFMTQMPVSARIAVSILAGAILVARSPSSAIAIVNELRARGPFTQTALGVTIIMDVVVIILFAANSSMADALLGGMNFNAGFVLLLILEISASLITGFILSKILLGILLIDFPKWLKTFLILSSGYLIFLLSSAVRSWTHHNCPVEILLEPLLICMVAGFLMSNTSRFRKEFLKILHDVGPAVYVAFFTLTGASLSLDILIQSWPIALALFLTRIISIFAGSFLGGTLARNPARANCASWMAYITQAGVGLGLAKEVVVEFPEFGNPFATIMISVIILNQIVGPPLFKLAIKLMKEDHSKTENGVFQGIKKVIIFGMDAQASALAMSLSSHGWDVGIALNKASDSVPDPGGIRVHRLKDLTLSELNRISCNKAGALVTMLSDEENHQICETAYENYGTQSLITRLNDRGNLMRFESLGVLIVDPSTAVVGLLDHFVRSPAAASLLMGMHGDRNIVDLRIQNPDFSGLALRDLRLPFDLVILSIRRRGVLFIPHGFTRLEAWDLVTVVGSADSIGELSLRFGVNQEEAMLQMVNKAAAKELNARTAGKEVKQIISGMHQLKKDRFDLLVEECDVIDIGTSTDRDGFFELASSAMSRKLEMPASEIFQMLVKREEEMTTVLAPGLAVPHIIVDGSEKFSILLARCKRGIKFSPSHPLVYAVFVLIGSKDERSFHLRALSAIAQIVLDPRFERKWMRARSREALRQVVVTADRKRD